MEAVTACPADPEIAGVTADSRLVRPDFLFAALPGARQDGRDFIGVAVRQGAAAVLAPAGSVWPVGVADRPLWLAAEPRRALSRIAMRLAGSQPGIVVAVTGTNGKTSTADFLRQFWKMSGTPAASIGTLGVVADGFAAGESLTTPDPVGLARTLAGLAQAGVGHVAMEASSHGLDQFRLDGVRLAAAGFSNLTRDHLDYHGSLEAYRAAKLRLFGALLPAGAVAAVNADMEDAALPELARIAQARGLDLRTVGRAGTALRLVDQHAVPHGQVLRLAWDGAAPVDVELPIPGLFQAENALLAAVLADATGVVDSLGKLSRLVGVRGRLERAALLGCGATAYVDYAHTPDALRRLLLALRPHCAGKLVLVFGAGGDRDRGKRPLMGAVAAELADRAIITDDNPRTEDAASIRAAIRAACPGGLEIADREAAIAAGLGMLGPGDILAVAGKGHESGQIVGDIVLPFDDASVIRRLVGGA